MNFRLNIPHREKPADQPGMPGQSFVSPGGFSAAC
jgi:hypothetical protein